MAQRPTARLPQTRSKPVRLKSKSVGRQPPQLSMRMTLFDPAGPVRLITVPQVHVPGRVAATVGSEWVNVVPQAVLPPWKKSA